MPDIGEDCTRSRHVREVEMMPCEDDSLRCVDSQGRYPSPLDDYRPRSSLGLSVYSSDGSSDSLLDCSFSGSVMTSRRSSLTSSISMMSPTPEGDTGFEFPTGRMRHKSANGAPLGRGPSSVALKHGCPQDTQGPVTEKVRRFSTRQRSCSFALGERAHGPLFSLPRQCEGVSIDNSRPRSSSLGCTHPPPSGKYSPLWRDAVSGAPRLSRSPSVASDMSSACSLSSTASDESYMRPRTLSGSSLTFHFPSPMHAVLMQYERTMVDPGASPPHSDTEDQQQAGKVSTQNTLAVPDGTTGRKDSTATLTGDVEDTRSVISDCESEAGSVHTTSDAGVQTVNTPSTSQRHGHAPVSQHCDLVSESTCCKENIPPVTDAKTSKVNNKKMKDLPVILPGTKVLKLLNKDKNSAPHSGIPSDTSALLNSHDTTNDPKAPPSPKNRSFVEEGYFSCPGSPKSCHDDSPDLDYSVVSAGSLPITPYKPSSRATSYRPHGDSGCFQDVFPSKYTLSWGKGDYVETVI